MYYRRKILLALIQKQGKKLDKLSLQKLLFLFCQKQQIPVFDFIPYKYGCYSFVSNKDLSVLEQHYHVLKSNKEEWILSIEEDFFNQLREEDKKILFDISKDSFFHNKNTLINYTYDCYPYYTLNSERGMSDSQKQNQVKEQEKITKQNKSVIFSLGYEGISIDAYLKKLIDNNISLLCDVRKNPISMKYGFSKNQLKNYCESLKINYYHIPQLGIISQRRKKLYTPQDYKILFEEYEETLPQKEEEINKLIKLYQEHQRIALTCFEKEHSFCHRGTLIHFLTKGKNILVQHI